MLHQNGWTEQQKQNDSVFLITGPEFRHEI